MWQTVWTKTQWTKSIKQHGSAVLIGLLVASLSTGCTSLWAPADGSKKDDRYQSEATPSGDATEELYVPAPAEAADDAAIGRNETPTTAAKPAPQPQDLARQNLAPGPRRIMQKEKKSLSGIRSRRMQQAVWA